jgi:hypothetical protein
MVAARPSISKDVEASLLDPKSHDWPKSKTVWSHCHAVVFLHSRSVLIVVRPSPCLLDAKPLVERQTTHGTQPLREHQTTHGPKPLQCGPLGKTLTSLEKPIHGSAHIPAATNDSTWVLLYVSLLPSSEIAETSDVSKKRYVKCITVLTPICGL